MNESDFSRSSFFFFLLLQSKAGYFFEDFESLETRWVPSAATKKTATGETAKYDGEWGFELPTKYPGNATKGLVVKTASKHHAVSALFDVPLVFDGTKDFVVQYEVKLTNVLNCGGAYLKLLSHVDGFSPEAFDDKTPYTIMFGPDKCGDSSKVTFRVECEVEWEAFCRVCELKISVFLRSSPFVFFPFTHFGS